MWIPILEIRHSISSKDGSVNFTGTVGSVTEAEDKLTLVSLAEDGMEAVSSEVVATMVVPAIDADGPASDSGETSGELLG